LEGPNRIRNAINNNLKRNAFWPNLFTSKQYNYRFCVAICVHQGKTIIIIQIYTGLAVYQLNKGGKRA